MQVAVFLLLCAGAIGKMFEFDISLARIEKRQTIYLAKFKFYDMGMIEIEAAIRGLSNTDGQTADSELQIALYDKEGFEKYSSMDSCDSKALHALKLFPVPLKVNASGKHFSRVAHTLSHKPGQADFIYFVLLDCGREASKVTRKGLKLRLLMDLKNQGSHHEAGDEQLTNTYVLLALVFLGVFGRQAREFWREMRRTEGSETNHAYILVNVSLLLKIVCLFLDIVDLKLIEVGGNSYLFLNFFSQALNETSQYLVAVLLVILARGWTTLFSSLDEFELFLPISVLIGIFKVVIIGLGKMEDNSSAFFHRYDSFIGWILVAFNLGLYLYFLEGTIQSARQVGRGSRYFGYFQQLAAFGSISFLLFPVLMLISLFLAPEDRSSFIELGRILSQLVTLGLLAYSTGHKRGVYKQIIAIQYQLPGLKEVK